MFFVYGGSLMIKKVLAIDNDPFMLDFFRDVLPDDRYELLTAENGLYALDLLDKVTPDIIFVDLVMPGIHGRKLCKIIRGMERLKDAYLVILSATLDEEPIDIEALGVNACIAKGPIERMAQLVLDVIEHPTAAALRCSTGEVIGAEKNVPKLITHELLNAGKYFEAIMEVMNEGILEIVSTGRIIYVNKAGLSLLGDQECRLLGSDFYAFFSETDKHKVLAEVENQGKPEPANGKCLVHINGRQVLLTILPIKNEEASSSIFILDDVTEKRLMKKQLIQAKKREALSTLGGGLTHNLNNLLLAIQENISLLTTGEGFNQEQLDILKTIEQYLQNSSKLTAQLIKIAKIGESEIKPTDLNKIIERSSRMFGRTHHEVRIHQKYKEGIWIVNAVTGQLEQVFLNLYLNARQAMPDGGDLFLETENITLDENLVRSLGMNGRNFVKISVQDTGKGIETREKIFAPFFSTQKTSVGQGLGLSFAYSTIRDHNGIITVQSEQGKGSIFTIYLPVSADQNPVEDHSNGKISIGKGSILFVEDEELICDIGKQMLEEMGYFCITAPDGRSALEIYEKKRHHIDMVILDMAMPDMGGGETFDKLIKVNPKIKVLVSNGHGPDGEVAEVLERGCSAFIQKPFKMNELSQKIRDVMSLN
jgi:two-component system, cell cycle sensor histidine kinase and response regulator CckA